MNYSKYLKILKKENSPAYGCTEPVAIAIAVSKATEVLGNLPDKITLKVSKNIFKNANSVTIPSTKLTGAAAAAALGAVICDSQRGLDIFSDISTQMLADAQNMLSNNLINISVINVPEKLYIEAMCHYSEQTSKVLIKNYHDEIVSIDKDGQNLFSKDSKESSIDILNMNIKEIVDFANNVDVCLLSFLEESIKMNLKIAEEGLQNKNSFTWSCLDLEKSDGKEFSPAILAAAACEARMSGSSLPVMTLAGSGNQGITAVLPVYAYSKNLNLSKEIMLKSMAISQLITIHIKQKMGRLSSVCGCAIAAATGVSGAITYMLGGGISEVGKSVNNMIANLSGLICDGAKPSCALKISTALAGATQCAYASVKSGFSTENTGIISENVEDSINNLSLISKEGMCKTEDVMLEIILKNNNKLKSRHCKLKMKGKAQLYAKKLQDTK